MQATSATACVGLRDDLAAEAGIPRNIAESTSSVWRKSIEDIYRVTAYFMLFRTKGT
ncbi:hypothetical protein ALQ85_04407 [Pseudomonas syringae]|nr:hypothetical protein ALQ85_04407 [Pseudomonas syringae]